MNDEDSEKKLIKENRTFQAYVSFSRNSVKNRLSTLEKIKAANFITNRVIRKILRKGSNFLPRRLIIHALRREACTELLTFRQNLLRLFYATILVLSFRLSLPAYAR